jgi:hypothetical protein
LVGSALLQLERNGVLFGVHGLVRSKSLDAADIVREAMLRQQVLGIASELPTNRNQSARKHDGDALPDRRPVYSAIGISSELRISRIYL